VIESNSRALDGLVEFIHSSVKYLYVLYHAWNRRVIQRITATGLKLIIIEIHAGVRECVEHFRGPSLQANNALRSYSRSIFNDPFKNVH
jgi:hypothetical protein